LKKKRKNEVLIIGFVVEDRVNNDSSSLEMKKLKPKNVLIHGELLEEFMCHSSISKGIRQLCLMTEKKHTRNRSNT